MDILKFPDRHLFEKTTEVTDFGTLLKTTLDAMYETMKSHNGLGLAANQVGLSSNVFVMDGPEGRVDFVNPVIVKKSLLYANLKEGCLSAPGDFFVIPERAEWVQVSYLNAVGRDQVSVFKGIHSVCVQHEIDHLNGLNFMENKSIPRHIRKALAKKWGSK